jgi:hypothetical protein
MSFENNSERPTDYVTDMPLASYPDEANPACASCDLASICGRGMRRADNEGRILEAMATEIEYTGPGLGPENDQLMVFNERRLVGNDSETAMLSFADHPSMRWRIRASIIKGLLERATRARLDGQIISDTLVEATTQCPGPQRSWNLFRLRTFGRLVCGLSNDNESRRSISRFPQRTPRVLTGEVAEHADTMAVFRGQGLDQFPGQDWLMRNRGDNAHWDWPHGLPASAEQVLAEQFVAGDSK